MKNADDNKDNRRAKRAAKRRPRKRKEDLTRWGRAERLIQRRMLSGLLVLVPLGITVFVLKFLYEITAGFLTPLLKYALGDAPGYLLPAVSVAVFVMVVYVVGFVASFVVGRRVISLTETVITYIPVVKTIYGASKQVVQALSVDEQRERFNSVVIVKFPHPGMRTLGFVTGTVLDDDGTIFYKVFVPTTPNPTTGFFTIVAPEEVCETDISVEDAAKVYMSLGLLSPARMTLRSPSEIGNERKRVPIPHEGD